MKVTIKLDESNWHDFRVECLKRKVSASEIIDRMIRQQRAQWRDEEKTRK